MKKWYRIFEIIDNKIGEAIPTRANWFDNIEDAELSLKSLINETKEVYTILPIYESET